jgi:two-component sensor histidine kinase
MLKPRSLYARLLWVMAMALVPAVVVSAFGLIALHQDREKALHLEAVRSAELLSLELERTVTGAENVLRTIAAAPVVKMGNGPECSIFVQEALPAIEFLAAIALADADGEVWCSSEPLAAEDVLSGDDIVATSLATHRRVVGMAIARKDGSSFLLPVAVRIQGADAATVGVALAYLDLRWLERRLEQRPLPQGGSLTVADQSGTIIARVPQPERFVGTIIPDDFIHLVSASQPGSLEVLSQDGTRRILGYVPASAVGAGVYVSAGLSVNEEFAVLRSVMSTTAVLMMIGVLLAAVLTYYTAQVSIVRPVQRLIDTIAAWRNGRTDARTGLLDQHGEICSAGHALDTFLDELLVNRDARRKSEEARELLRDEMEHRQKNLLATVQAIARQTFGRSDLASDNLAFSQRLTAISEANRLLRKSNWQSTPLHSLVRSAVATFVGNDRARVTATGPDLVVKANVASALALALHELCTNAVKYGALGTEGGTVAISWDIVSTAAGETVTMQWIERGGPLVKPPERSGFGSRIIRDALSAQTGGRVEIDYDPAGLVFRLTAPTRMLMEPGASAEAV